MGVCEQSVLATTNFVADGDVIEDDPSMHRHDFGREMSLNVFSILPKFLLLVRKSEFSRFDGGVPSAGPFAARLDLLCRF